MFKEKFQIVIQKDEEIRWCNSANPTSSVLKGLLPAILVGGFLSIWGTMFFGGIFSFATAKNGDIPDGPSFLPILIILPAIIIFYVIYAYLNAKNTYFCITNKRIIKRSGAFNNNFIHYTLKNVGTVQVIGGIADNNDSATLLITTKDFHTDSKGNTHASRLKITSLNNAYEAYNILSEATEGNNESLRVKLEK